MFKSFKKFSGKIKESVAKVFRVVFPDKVDERTLEVIERRLYSSDFGVAVTSHILSEIRAALKQTSELSKDTVIDIASNVLSTILSGAEGELKFSEYPPEVICLVGANGSGKTTTAAKVANFYKNLGKRVLLGSCDTFRAAANEQLTAWAERLSIDIVSSHHGSDPAAVAFDSYRAAVARNNDLLILDTAGRLHVKANLMAELQKIFRVLKKANAGINLHVWLVVDSTIGNNTLSSAKMFHSSIGLTGMVITKLDGTSSGGALVGVYKDLNIPIFFIGSGERPEDILPFSVDKYVNQIFDRA